MIDLRLLMMGDFAGVNSIRDSSKKGERKKKASGNGSVEERNVDRGLERRGS